MTASSTSSRSSQYAMLDRHAPDFPSNKDLPFLPPLPETPRHEQDVYNMPISSPTREREQAGQPFRSRYQHNRQFSQMLDDVVEGEVLIDSDATLPRSDRMEGPFPGSEYPTLSTRHSGMNTPRNISPVKHLAPTSSRQVSLVAHDQSLMSVASLRIPSNAANASLIGDCGPPSITGDDDSFDFKIEEIRPWSVKKPARERDHADGELQEQRVIDISARPTVMSAIRPSSKVWEGDQSTLLPQSPAKTAHLLSRSHAISTIAPPWNDADTTLSGFQTFKQSTCIDVHDTSSKRSLPRSHTQPNLSQTRSASKSKRNFPASSSAQSLEAVGEEGQQYLEASMLLPSSPAKLRHLLNKEEMILGMSMSLLEDGPSFTVALPRSARKTPPTSATPRRRNPVYGQPVEKLDDPDTTLDVKDLMSRMSKPKRPSGTEESFVNLLGEDNGFQPMDISMMGADDSFLPSTFQRAPAMSSRTASPGKEDRTAELAFPRSHSTKSLHMPSPSRPHRSVLESARKTPRRSKSLSEAEPESVPVQRRPSPLKQSAPVESRPALRLPRVRTSLMPAPVNRRMSLSAGALPMPKSASIRELPLPKPSSAMPATGARSSARTSTLVPLRSKPLVEPVTAQRSRPGSTPAVPRPALTRPGSSTIGVTSASVANVRPSASSRTTFRPTSTNRAVAPALTEPTSRLSRPPTARPAGLPRPGDGISARSAPAVPQPSRTFGTNASGTTNRLSRPSAVAPGDPKSKLSSAPGTTLRRNTTSSKTRAMSTPASALAKVSVTSRPAMPSGLRITRTSQPPSASGVQRLAYERTADQPRSTKSSIPSSASANLADLRARVERLKARQGAK